MDGTLTKAGKFSPALLSAFRQLKRRGIQVLVVTGRSAGWVSGLVNYLDVVGAIAENGGIYYPSIGETAGDLLANISNVEAYRQQLRSVFACLKEDFPNLQPATDNRFRLTDWTFINTDFSATELTHMQQLCSQLGWGFTYSSIQCHIKPLHQAKGSAVLTIARQLIPGITSEKIVTVGDSPNDESLFIRDDFPYSVGGANIAEFSDRLQHQPTFVTRAREGEGFCELVTWLLEA
ncbi:MAG: HAD family hydrolase [Cyanobacteria bacterium P01_E01_bin.34]